jgi:16S rRNA (guanine527-N7)-methyltransferase
VFHVKHDELLADAAHLGIALDRLQAWSLAAYEDHLRDQACRMGLIGRRDVPMLRDRHILDSLRAAPFVGARHIDLGSGAGLPGIVVAIARPDASVHLVDSGRRRVAFLELVVERLGLTNVVPVLARVEGLSGEFDSATARAFGDAEASWMAAERLLTPPGRLIYFAGERFRASEIEGPSVRADVVAARPPLASSGPLVIMTRQ